MSRRRERGGRAQEAARSGQAAEAARGGAGGGAARPDRVGGAPFERLPAQLAVLTGVFAITVGIAELAGAANLGVSFGIGQVAFTLVLLVLLTRA